MTFTMILLAALAVAAIAAAVWSVVRDGYRPVPTRTFSRRSYTS